MQTNINDWIFYKYNQMLSITSHHHKTKQNNVNDSLEFRLPLSPLSGACSSDGFKTSPSSSSFVDFDLFFWKKRKKERQFYSLGLPQEAKAISSSPVYIHI